jgi:hypothetical protein
LVFDSFCGWPVCRASAPEAVQPGVDHLQQAADVGGLGPVQEEFRFRCVGVLPAAALKHAEGHQRVEEVPRATGVELQPVGQGVQVRWPLSQFGEDAQFDGAEQGLRPPETEAELENLVRRKFLGHSPVP